MKQKHKIVFQPSGRTVYVLAGTTVFEAAARAGLLLQGPCGGKGTCGKCQVRVAEGSCRADEASVSVLGEERVADGVRLACQAGVFDDCVVEIPATSLYQSSSKILTADADAEISIDPPARAIYVELPEPSGEDDVADLKRLERAVGSLHVHLDVLRDLPLRLRSAGFRGTAVVCDDRLIGFEPGGQAVACCGVAFDLGTTTLVGTLIDLADGRELGVAACMNPQVASGDDVVSRILRVREDVSALGQMQETVVGALNGLITQLTGECGVSRERVYDVAVAGNTTMQHLFCGINPSALGELPFPAAYNRGLTLRAAEVGLGVNPCARLFVFPNIGGFVGGDTVAGVLATSVHRTEEPVLFIDIGTNGEIVLGKKGQVLATSTAAGPAFEGARIAAGMRATDGAIEKIVRSEGDLWYNVIGNTAPSGICGTALIDLAAELLRTGVLDPTGRILSAEDAPSDLAPGVRDRLVQTDGHVDFRIVPADTSKTGEDICLTQRDVRELQLATGAIRAGVSIMLRKAGLEPEDLKEVLLAGAFGNFIRRSNARRIGLLPQLPSARIRFVGNASSMGAKAALLSRQARAEAESIGESAEHVDLSLDPEFQMEFGMAMMFPEAELTAS